MKCLVCKGDEKGLCKDGDKGTSEDCSEHESGSCIYAEKGNTIHRKCNDETYGLGGGKSSTGCYTVVIATYNEIPN